MNDRLAVLTDAWRLSAPYWLGDSRLRAKAMLVTVLVLNLVVVGTSVMFTLWQGAFFNALEEKNWGDFVGLLLWGRYDPESGFAPGFSLNVFIFVPATVFANYYQQMLQIHWRRWQTQWLMDRWLASANYYRLEAFERGPDNPDQRISEDVRLFVDHNIELMVGFLRALVTLLSFIALLWILSGPVALFGGAFPGSLVWIALFYAALGTVLTHVIGKRLVGLNYVRERAEADFRFSLMGIRKNAECIAFFRSESSERSMLDIDFKTIVENWRKIVGATRDLLFFQSGFGQLALVVPFALVAPAYFAGRIQLGAIFQTSNAFVQVQESFSWIVLNYGRLAEWAATTHRLSRFERSLEAAQGVTTEFERKLHSNNVLSLDRVSVALPDARTIVRGASIEICAGERVWLSGLSGSGKSTLLRVIAGLWPWGSGTVSVPDARQLFLPQTPYLPKGTLKQCVCYPGDCSEHTDEQVSRILRQVGLDYIESDLLVVEEWGRRLSGGEQQRIGFARAILFRPEWLFMDEATANLDEAADMHCHQLLRQYLPDITVVSVLHRTSAGQFYNRKLLLENGRILDSDPA